MVDQTTLIAIGVALAILGHAGLFFGLRLHRRRQRERREAMRHLAQTLRASFAEEADAALLAEIGRLEPRQHKRHEKIANLVRGERDGQAYELMDYSFVTSGGKNSHHHHRTVLRCRLDVPVPDFELRGENALDRVGAWLGWDDIDFPHRPEFSRRYSLDGADAGAVRAFFSDRALSTFEIEKDSFHVAGRGDSLLIRRSRAGFEPIEELGPFLDRALALAEPFRRR